MGKLQKLTAGLVLGLTLSSSAYAVEFETIRTNMNSMTSVAWDAYTKSLEGQPISWQGWVSDVKEKWGGGYKLLVDMDPPGSVSVQDVYIDDIPVQQASQLAKDQKVTIKGKITSVRSVLGSCAVNVELNK